MSVEVEVASHADSDVCERYLNEDDLLVPLQVQGCIHVGGDPLQLLGVAVVQQEPGVPPHSASCHHTQFNI